MFFFFTFFWKAVANELEQTTIYLMGFTGLTPTALQLLKPTHHQRLSVHPSRRKEKHSELQEDGVTGDRDQPGPLLYIGTLNGSTLIKMYGKRPLTC